MSDQVWQLAPDVRIASDAHHSFLVRDAPLHIFKISPSVLPLLRACIPGTTVENALESARQLGDGVAAAVLHRLEDAGLVARVGQPDDAALPAISIVIPVRNRPQAIVRCLASLNRLHYPKTRLDIIVVDDASTDETPAAVYAFGGEIPLELVTITKHRGQASCRNVAAERARGEILAFIDSDCEAAPDWLMKLVPEFFDEDTVAVGGGVWPLEERHWLQRYEAVRSPLHQGPARAIVRPGTAVSYLAACNLLVRRRPFLAAGGFVIDRGEEVDLLWRFCAQKLTVRYQPTGIVYHDHRFRLGEFVNRRTFYAGSEPILLRRHPGNVRPLNLPLGLVLALALGMLVTISRAWLLLPALLLPILAELGLTWRRWLTSGAPIRRWVMVRATGNRYVSAAYFSAANLVRYYTVPLVLLSLVAGAIWSPARWLLLLVAACFLAVAAADWWRLRPRLHPGAFIAGHVLDTVAYHIGILAACIRQRTVRPLQMRIRIVT